MNDNVIRLMASRPDDPRYPNGVKVIEVTTNGHIEVKQDRDKPQESRPLFLFELDEHEKEQRLAELKERLSNGGG